LFEVGLTAALVFEYEAVCKRLIGSVSLTAHDIDQVIDYLCQVGKRCVVHFRVRPSVGDPDDEMVLEAAVASGGHWIVTHNVRDLADGAARYGVEVLSPAEALRRLGGGAMSVLQVELPSELQSELRELGLVDEARLAAWVTEAVREKLAASKQLAYLEERAARGDRDAFRQVLAKVPPVEPAEEDRW